MLTYHYYLPPAVLATLATATPVEPTKVHPRKRPKATAQPAPEGVISAEVLAHSKDFHAELSTLKALLQDALLVKDQTTDEQHAALVDTWQRIVAHPLGIVKDLQPRVYLHQWNPKRRGGCQSCNGGYVPLRRNLALITGEINHALSKHKQEYGAIPTKV